MDFYVNAMSESQNTPIRIHPILLSLSEAMNNSKTNPDINTVSENDERVLTNSIYTLPSKLPPLEMHILGGNGPSLLPNQNDYALTSVAGCGECMKYRPQDNSGEGSTAAQDNSGEGSTAAQDKSEAAVHTPEDNISHSSSTSPSTPRKAKKRRRALSGSVQGHRSNKLGTNIVMLIRRAKGKQPQQTGSLGVNHSSSEDISDQPPQEDRGRREVEEPCMFAGSSVQRFSNCICCWPKVQTAIQL